MSQSFLDPSNRWIIKGYGNERPFSSFLPGIAGPMGVPLWAFYVNRGQAIASFGIQNKDAPILEYYPANQAYQNTPLLGFRTFLKIDQGDKRTYYEPFAPWNEIEANCDAMAIGLNELEIEEDNLSLNLHTKVQYYILPNEPFAGLVRQVTIQNRGKSRLSIDFLDGLPRLIPYGVNNNLLKEMGRTLEAWMEVFNVHENVPYFRLRASVVDRAEVEAIHAGHFAVSFINDGNPVHVIVDPAVIFGPETSLNKPLGFVRQTITTLFTQPQITCGRTPCCFFADHVDLLPDEMLQIKSLYGHISDLESLDTHLPRLIQTSFFQNKYQEAIDLANDLTQVVETHTAFPIFDSYCRQNFLDNILRGGWPIDLGGHIFPIYSRKHGDLERDYNAFSLASESFSQGEGSYRDVNQNCRCNVFFKPEIGDFDIRTFLSLIQIDGYNPRSIQGYTFILTPDQQKKVLTYVSEPEKISYILGRPFSPGKLIHTIFDTKVDLSVSLQEFVTLVLTAASQHLNAEFHEGYWIDHWEYNLDLIESYLAVYPEKKAELLFGAMRLPFFDSPIFVQPRSKRAVLVNGVPRQLNSLIEDKGKTASFSTRTEHRHWSRMKDGDIYYTSLFTKLLLIALIKYSTMDPWGMGIEMEAGRPGWDDALNGLPGLFGSGMAETYELLRWLDFIRKAIQASPNIGVEIPIEAGELLNQVTRCLDQYNHSSDEDKADIYWDGVATARENFRQQTRLGFNGDETTIEPGKIDQILASFQAKVTSGIQLAIQLNNGIPPTYFIFNIDQFDLREGQDPQGNPYIEPRRFTPKNLPLFLEGPVRMMKIMPDVDTALLLYQKIKESALYDRKLRMYKLNASLTDQPQDIGRVRAFPPGWLENESIWLHMEYKYLLEILKAGLYKQFYDELKNLLVPFFDPQIYGRSTLENSSFLVSSAHPDSSLHGAGFVARLSGSTAEFLSIWIVMMAGKQPFFDDHGNLNLSLRPTLPGWLFSDDSTVSFKFLGRCMVTYHNSERQYTHNLKPKRIEFTLSETGRVEIAGPDLGNPYAEMVRNGKITKLDVWL